MKRTKQIADRFREVILNGKWIANTNFKDQLLDLTWEQATRKIGSLNSIADLTFHINYYTAGILNVLEGGALEIRDKFSFDRQPINSQKEWNELFNKLCDNAAKFASILEHMQDDELEADFVDEKYGKYQRNLEGMIEHSYYHLGQVVLIKKMILEQDNSKN